jgi:uncharacterized protein (DUF3820 family)/uncharacterized protein YlaI
MYTDETVLDYGKYKGKALKDIPKQYFVNTYRSGGDDHAALKEYIEANKEMFPELAIYFLKNSATPLVTFICDKRTYPTKKAAIDSIVKPTSKTSKPVPIRAYECPDCSGWHLTSKPDKRFEK